MNHFLPEQIDFRSAGYEESAFNAFYEAYFPKLYSYVSLLTRESAWTEELTCQIFEKILRGLPGYDAGKGGLNTWIYAIARNQILDFQKSKQHRLNQSLESETTEFRSQDPDPEEVSILREKQETVRLLLEQLPNREREVLILKFYGGWSTLELAAHAGLRENQIHLLVHRSLRKLKTIIARQNIRL